MEGPGGKQELCNAKKCFGFGNLSFIDPSGITVFIAKREQMKALCCGLERAAKIIGAYVRLGSLPVCAETRK